MATAGISGTTSASYVTPDAAEKQSVIEGLGTTLSSAAQDAVTVDNTTALLSNNLSVLAQQVLERLNQAVGNEIPGGLSSLAPEDHTPEKTAQAIVDGVSQLFSVFAQQNKSLSGDALVDKFLETIRGGIARGYAEADQILGDTGAYDLTGIRDGIDQTKQLVESKLKDLEAQLRGRPTSADGSASTSTVTSSSTAAVTVSTVA